jgi:hypothetical protein
MGWFPPTPKHGPSLKLQMFLYLLSKQPSFLLKIKPTWLQSTQSQLLKLMLKGQTIDRVFNLKSGCSLYCILLQLWAKWSCFMLKIQAQMTSINNQQAFRIFNAPCFCIFLNQNSLALCWKSSLNGFSQPITNFEFHVKSLTNLC